MTGLLRAVMPPSTVVAGMEFQDASVLVWIDGTYVRQLHRWPVITATGRLAIALAWPLLQQHHGAILGDQRKFRTSGIA